MSIVKLLSLLHTVAEEHAQRAQTLKAKEATVEEVRDEIITISKTLRDGRFRLAEYRTAAEDVDRRAGEVASQLTELTRLRDVKTLRRAAISDLMKQSDDPSAKKSLRRERAEIGTAVSELEEELEAQRGIQAEQRSLRSKLSTEIDNLEVELGELERRNYPLQSVLMTFEEHCEVVELRWLERVITERLDDERASKPSSNLVRDFIDASVALMDDYQSGQGLFRRDYQRAEVSALVSEAQIWALCEHDTTALQHLESWNPRAALVETYQGLRFAVGAALRQDRVARFRPELTEFVAMDGLVGAMSRALFAVGQTSQNECRIAYDEWLRLESQFARANALDEARVVSGSSIELFRMWVEQH